MLKIVNFHLNLTISIKVTNLEYRNNESTQLSSSRKMSHDAPQSDVRCELQPFRKKKQNKQKRQYRRSQCNWLHRFLPTSDLKLVCDWEQIMTGMQIRIYISMEDLTCYNNNYISRWRANVVRTINTIKALAHHARTRAARTWTGARRLRARPRARARVLAHARVASTDAQLINSQARTHK